MTQTKARHHYVTIWYWLVGLLFTSVLIVYLPLGKPLIVLLVFGAAMVKAALVALNYMHLKSEQLLIYTLALAPLLLFLVLLAVLFDDLSF